MLVLSTIVISCSSNKNTVESATENIVITELGDNEKNVIVTETEQEDILNPLTPNTFKVPLREIYVDVPDYNDIESGYTEIFKDGERKYITFNYFEESACTSASEAFDISYPQFKVNVSSWHRINTEEFTSMEEVEINGIAAQKVTGTVEYGMKNMTYCYLYGYSFVFEDVPCAIIGVVSDKSQPQEEIDELIAIVDAMMESVRTEP